jgi:very-short-patch-repair endonuclease
MFKQRYNVAASRARDQMWVVHSLDPQTDLQPGDLRRRLIEHAQAPELLTRTFDNQEANVQSALERDVMKRLVQAGYHVIPRWKVGSMSLDLAVEGNGKRLAIECDGDRDFPLEKLRDDIERQSMLERLGWTFARVRGSIFFREPNRAMRPLFDKLQSLEISSVDQDPASDQADGSSNLSELTERVIRRADELREEWSALRNKRRLRSHLSESLP